MLRLYSVCLGSNRPTATDSFVGGPTPMDLGYSDNHRKSSYISITYTIKCNNS